MKPLPEVFPTHQLMPKMGLDRGWRVRELLNDRIFRKIFDRIFGRVAGDEGFGVGKITDFVPGTFSVKSCKWLERKLNFDVLGGFGGEEITDFGLGMKSVADFGFVVFRQDQQD